MLSLPPITLRLRGWKLIDRVALAFLILCAVALGAGCGLLFVYASDLPEIRALETYRPDVVTEVYADDGQLAGSFALQREAAGQLTVIGVNFGDHVGAVGFQRANFRQIAGVNEKQAAARAQGHGAKNQKSQRHAVNQFPAAQPQRY